MAFYAKSEIKSLITCSICDNIYISPRILDCGHTSCNECIQNTAQTYSRNQVRCNTCKKLHNLPCNGFLPNQLIEELTALKSFDVNQSDMVKQLRLKFVELEEKVNELKAQRQNGPDVIKDYCMSLKAQVQLRKEETAQLLENEAKKLIHEIDEYEQSCLLVAKLTKHLEKANGNSDSEIESENLADGFARAFNPSWRPLNQCGKKEPANIQEDVASFIETGSKLLLCSELSDMQVRESTKRADEHLTNLKSEIERENSKWLSKQTLVFSPAQFESLILGKLTRTKHESANTN